MKKKTGAVHSCTVKHAQNKIYVKIKFIIGFFLLCIDSDERAFCFLTFGSLFNCRKWGDVFVYVYFRRSSSAECGIFVKKM